MGKGREEIKNNLEMIEKNILELEQIVVLPKSLNLNKEQINKLKLKCSEENSATEDTQEGNSENEDRELQIELQQLETSVSQNCHLFLTQTAKKEKIDWQASEVSNSLSPETQPVKQLELQLQDFKKAVEKRNSEVLNELKDFQNKWSSKQLTKKTEKLIRRKLKNIESCIERISQEPLYRLSIYRNQIDKLNPKPKFVTIEPGETTEDDFKYQESLEASRKHKKLNQLKLQFSSLEAENEGFNLSIKQLDNLDLLMQQDNLLKEGITEFNKLNENAKLLFEKISPIIDPSSTMRMTLESQIEQLHGAVNQLTKLNVTRTKLRKEIFERAVVVPPNAETYEDLTKELDEIKEETRKTLRSFLLSLTTIKLSGDKKIDNFPLTKAFINQIMSELCTKELNSNIAVIENFRNRILKHLSEKTTKPNSEPVALVLDEVTINQFLLDLFATPVPISRAGTSSPLKKFEQNLNKITPTKFLAIFSKNSSKKPEAPTVIQQASTDIPNSPTDIEKTSTDIQKTSAEKQDNALLKKQISILRHLASNMNNFSSDEIELQQLKALQLTKDQQGARTSEEIKTLINQVKHSLSTALQLFDNQYSSEQEVKTGYKIYDQFNEFEKEIEEINSQYDKKKKELETLPSASEPLTQISVLQQKTRAQLVQIKEKFMRQEDEKIQPDKGLNQLANDQIKLLELKYNEIKCEKIRQLESAIDDTERTLHAVMSKEGATKKLAPYSAQLREFKKNSQDQQFLDNLRLMIKKGYYSTQKLETQIETLVPNSEQVGTEDHKNSLEKIKLSELGAWVTSSISNLTQYQEAIRKDLKLGYGNQVSDLTRNLNSLYKGNSAKLIQEILQELSPNNPFKFDLQKKNEELSKTVNHITELYNALNLTEPSQFRSWAMRFDEAMATAKKQLDDRDTTLRNAISMERRLKSPSYNISFVLMRAIEAEYIHLRDKHIELAKKNYPNHAETFDQLTRCDLKAENYAAFRNYKVALNKIDPQLAKLVSRHIALDQINKRYINTNLFALIPVDEQDPKRYPILASLGTLDEHLLKRADKIYAEKIISQVIQQRANSPAYIQSRKVMDTMKKEYTRILTKYIAEAKEKYPDHAKLFDTLEKVDLKEENRSKFARNQSALDKIDPRLFKLASMYVQFDLINKDYISNENLFASLTEEERAPKNYPSNLTPLDLYTRLLERVDKRYAAKIIVNVNMTIHNAEMETLSDGIKSDFIQWIRIHILKPIQSVFGGSPENDSPETNPPSMKNTLLARFFKPIKSTIWSTRTEKCLVDTGNEVLSSLEEDETISQWLNGNISGEIQNGDIREEIQKFAPAA